MREGGSENCGTVLWAFNPKPTSTSHPPTADRWPSMMMDDDAVEEAVARLDKIEVRVPT